jgi:hypothetical protein
VLAQLLAGTVSDLCHLRVVEHRYKMANKLDAEYWAYQNSLYRLLSPCPLHLGIVRISTSKEVNYQHQKE